MANTTRAILIQAHTLIQDGQYERARALLLPIADHPTAAKWLDKIDETLSPDKPRKRKPKAETTPTPQQDEKPASVASAVKSKSKPRSSESQLAVIIAGTVGVCILIFGVFFLLSGESLNIKLPRLIHETQTYTNSYMTFQHSTSWGEQDLSEISWCRSIDYVQCLHYAVNGSGMELFIQNVSLPQYLAPDEFAAYNWNSDLEDSRYSVSNPALFDTMVGGVPALIQMYEVEDRASFGEGFIIDIFVPDGYNGYVFSFTTGRNICALGDRLLSELGEIMSSVRFRSQTAGREADGYSAASPVMFTVPKCD